MKKVVTFAAALFAMSLQSAWAADSTPTMPKCASGDSVVGLNTQKNIYMTQAQMDAQSKGMTPAETQAMMTKNHVSMVCLTQAKALGATNLTPATPGGVGNATDPGGVRPGASGGPATQGGNAPAKTPGGTGNATDPGGNTPPNADSKAAANPSGPANNGNGNGTTPGGTGNATDPGAVKPK